MSELSQSTWIAAATDNTDPIMQGPATDAEVSYFQIKAEILGL